MCVNPKSVLVAKTYLFGNAFPSRLPNAGLGGIEPCHEEPQGSAVALTSGSRKFEFQSDCTLTFCDLENARPAGLTAV
jgi:hypothetical protein